MVSVLAARSRTGFGVGRAGRVNEDGTSTHGNGGSVSIEEWQGHTYVLTYIHTYTHASVRVYTRETGSV